MGDAMRLKILLAATLALFGPLAAQAQLDPARTDSPEVAQFQDIEDNWSLAVNQHDQYSLELILSLVYLDISSDGAINTRDSVIAQLVSHTNNISKFEQKVIAVRVIGAAAVVNGTYSLYRLDHSAPVLEKGVFTHVFEHIRQGWVCVSAQRTGLREDTANISQAPKPKKQSNAELPFHIPFLYKGADTKQQSAPTDQPSQPK
jgi:hypothetical protein